MVILIFFLSFLHQLFSQDDLENIYSKLEITQIPIISVEQINSLQTSVSIVDITQQNTLSSRIICPNCLQPYNNGAIHHGSMLDITPILKILENTSPVIVRVNGLLFTNMKAIFVNVNDKLHQ
ncbi:MAG: hypothetical protein HEEMFOPI_01841 [Holosporales bacterium]